VVTCAWCGAIAGTATNDAPTTTTAGSSRSPAADEPPPTWTRQSSARGDEWLCERCTRENLRSIEGRLDSAWW
jgi:hypothetical protein